MLPRPAVRARQPSDPCPAWASGPALRATCHGPRQPSLSALYDQIPLELRDGRDDCHSHLPGAAGQIHTAEGETVNADAQGFQLGNRQRAARLL
jgi:hypothetical protein